MQVYREEETRAVQRQMESSFGIIWHMRLLLWEARISKSMRAEQSSLWKQQATTSVLLGKALRELHYTIKCFKIAPVITSELQFICGCG